MDNNVIDVCCVMYVLEKLYFCTKHYIVLNLVGIIRTNAGENLGILASALSTTVHSAVLGC